MSPHSHHYVEFMCLESGSCLFQLPDKEHQLQAGGIPLLEGGIPHGMIVEEPTRILNLGGDFEPSPDSQLSVESCPWPLPQTFPAT